VKAVILAGGRGTRLGRLAAGRPKPLLDLAGAPVLQRQVDVLRRQGITDVCLVTGHLGDQIRDHFGDGAAFGVRIEYFHERTPLGTAGALPSLAPRLPDTFLVLYGDLVFDVDLDRFVRFHRGRRALATAVVHPNDHPHDSDLVVVSREGRITGLLPRIGRPPGDHANRALAGMFVLERALLGRLRAGRPQALERDLVAPAIPGGRVYAYRTAEYVRDMGTPERAAAVREALERGVVARRSRSRPQRAVFLDRDGTLNEHVGLVTAPDDLRVQPAAYEALRLLNASDRLSVVVTNQPVVARGLCSPEELDGIHRRLESELGRRGAYVDDLYCCPHHPDRGFPGENPEYKVACACRKPATGMLDRAAAEHNIDLGTSYLVGDTTRDVQTGRNAGTRTILVRTGLAGRDGRFAVEPDLVCDDVSAAVRAILAEAGRDRATSHA
jgi:histidinol-phosphate phosphatase family protein